MLQVNIEKELSVRVDKHTLFSGILGEMNGNSAIDLQKIETSPKVVN